MEKLLQLCLKHVCKQTKVGTLNCSIALLLPARLNLYLCALSKDWAGVHQQCGGKGGQGEEGAANLGGGGGGGLGGGGWGGEHTF